MHPDSIHAAIDAGRALTQLHAVEGFKPVLISPHQQGTTKITLDPEKLSAPRFLTAAPKFHEVYAFVSYVNAFKNQHSRIFYTQDGVFVAVIDYHRSANVRSENGEITCGDPSPRHGDHQAFLALKRSPEWDAWKKNSEEAMTQQDFAEFIEDNIKDILKPDPAVMVQVATGLHATIGATFRQATNLANGEIQIQYDETVNGAVRGTAESVPTAFEVGLRPFMGCNRYPIECRLRYRVSGGNLHLHYKALHLDWITETALDAIVSRVADETGIMPALGAHDSAAFAKGT